MPKRPKERDRAAWVDLAKKPAKKARKAIEPPRELWMVWFHKSEAWMGGSNDDEMACFLTERSAVEAGTEIVHNCGGEFTVVQVLPRKRAKAKR